MPHQPEEDLPLVDSRTVKFQPETNGWNSPVPSTSVRKGSQAILEHLEQPFVSGALGQPGASREAWRRPRTMAWNLGCVGRTRGENVGGRMRWEGEVERTAKK